KNLLQLSNNIFSISNPCDFSKVLKYLIQYILNILFLINIICMITKIESVDGIDLTKQYKIVSDYIEAFGIDGIPKITKKNTGIKIESCGRRYHVSCHKTKTMWIFKIWWGI